MPLALARSDSLNLLGSVLLDLGRTDEALAAFRQALEARGNLVAEAPGELNFRRKLSNSRANVSRALAALGQHAQAATEAQQANRTRADLAQSNPDDHRLLRDLAQGQYGVAQLQQQAGDVSQALASAVRARVESVSLSRNGLPPTLNVAGFGPVAMSEVIEIL